MIGTAGSTAFTEVERHVKHGFRRLLLFHQVNGWRLLRECSFDGGLPGVGSVDRYSGLGNRTIASTRIILINLLLGFELVLAHTA